MADTQQKKELQEVIQAFADRPLHDAALSLFATLPNNIADLEAQTGLAAAERGKISSKRGALRKLLTDTHWTAMENVRLIDEVLATTERVLNPGAHGGESPLYEAEVHHALDLVKKLEKCLA